MTSGMNSIHINHSVIKIVLTSRSFLAKYRFQAATWQIKCYFSALKFLARAMFHSKVANFNRNIQISIEIYKFLSKFTNFHRNLQFSSESHHRFNQNYIKMCQFDYINAFDSNHFKSARNILTHTHSV